MYDQFEAAAEADLIAHLRAQGGDAFAVTTMRNHWAGYVPDEALDALVAFGVTHARLPVGFWLWDTPVVTITPTPQGGVYDFGFNHEGFVTGGLNYVEATLAKLKARGIKVLVDLHAMPGGSSRCASYAGWQVDTPLFWTSTPPATNATPINSSCGGGPYHTSRGSARTWLAVGEESVLALGAWVASLQHEPLLADVVVGVEIVNEPGLGFDGVQERIEQLLKDVVPPMQALLAAAGSDANITVNFIGPNDVGVGAWLGSQVSSGAFNASRLLVDFHEYYNWNGPESWSQLAQEICSTTRDSSQWAQYTHAGLNVVIGEWSCSTNLGAKAYTDLSDPTVLRHLKTLYANQMSLFAARGGDAPGAVGQHHWALRMGSGWDPRPTADAPNGTQVSGSAWDHALPGFSAAVWGLGELIRVGVAVPLRALNITGVCACVGCSVGG